MKGGGYVCVDECVHARQHHITSQVCLSVFSCPYRGQVRDVEFGVADGLRGGARDGHLFCFAVFV